MKRFLLLACCSALVLAACVAPQESGRAKAGAKPPPGALFQPSDDALAEVRATLARAGIRDRRALVVLGANWCHDSRALAARLQEPPLRGLVEGHYETVLVDVGYLDQARDVAVFLGTPIYYATPTVLIVDPATGRLVNDANRHQWGSAASIGMAESLDYFEQMAASEMPVSVPSLTDEARAEIDAYEQRMAEKVARGYDRVGPMLRAYKEGGAVPASFEDDWTEVAEFRTSVPGLVSRLRQEMAAAIAANVEAPAFPPVSPYSWE